LMQALQEYNMCSDRLVVEIDEKTVRIANDDAERSSLARLLGAPAHVVDAVLQVAQELHITPLTLRPMPARAVERLISWSRVRGVLARNQQRYFGT